jgi:transketolase
MRKAALNTIAFLVDENPNVMFIGSDLGAGTLSEPRSRHPNRILMEGIAEQHLVGFGAGLAMEGFIPYVHTIGTFLTRRALEQVVIDVALHGLPVRLVASGGGLVYAPLGPTHQATDDFALMRSIPGMLVSAPADPLEMQLLLKALVQYPGPAYIRIGKGGEPNITDRFSEFALDHARVWQHGDSLAIVTTGVMLHECARAVEGLGIDRPRVTLAHLPVIAPLDEDFLVGIAGTHDHVLVVEEHQHVGGLSSAVADTLASHRGMSPLSRITLPQGYAHNFGSQRDHWVLHGLDSAGIASVISRILGESGAKRTGTAHG